MIIIKNLFKKRELMIFGCHHKVGTSWFTKILTHIANELNLQFQYSNQTGIKPQTDIFFDDHSRVDLNNIKNYKAIHLIRDPRDIIISGYHYHKWTKEEWANQPKEHWNGLSYKEKINTLDEKEAIIFEMNNIGKETIDEMLNWDYNNNDVLEIKYEDLLANEKEIFTKIFEHYKFSKKSVQKCVQIAQSYSFDKMKNLESTEHLRKGIAGDWKNYFDEEIIKEFKSSFPDTLVSLRYEKNNNW